MPSRNARNKNRSWSLKVPQFEEDGRCRVRRAERRSIRKIRTGPVVFINKGVGTLRGNYSDWIRLGSPCICPCMCPVFSTKPPAFPSFFPTISSLISFVQTRTGYVVIGTKTVFIFNHAGIYIIYIPFPQVSVTSLINHIASQPASI